MPSEIIPSLDLAPSVPSRIVTVHATDVTKGTPQAGRTVTFKLRGDLRVPADGAIISAGSVTLTLDAEGKGRVRLPCYTDDTRADSADGEWYLEVSKSWVGQTDLIRVPTGSTPIALAAIEPVREIPLHMAPSWLVTGAGVEVVEGAQWGATVVVTGGVARFRFTVPPGGEAWSKGALTTSTDRASLTPGVYRIQSGPVATALGIPVARQGALQVLDIAPNTPSRVHLFITNDINDGSPLEIWVQASTHTGAWTRPWHRIHPVDLTNTKKVLVASDDLLNLDPGLYWVASGTVATDIGLPVGRGGRVQVDKNITGVGGNRRVITFTTDDINDGASLEIWTRTTNHAGDWTRPWHRIYPSDTDPTPSPGLAYAASGPWRHKLLVERQHDMVGGPIDLGTAIPVAFVWDDYPWHMREYVIPLLRARGLKATFAVCARTMEPDRAPSLGGENITWPEVDAWVAEGLIEVANHSRNHQSASTEQEQYDEIVTGLHELQAHIPSGEVLTWVQPSVTYPGFDNGTSIDNWSESLAGQLILGHHATATGLMPVLGAPGDLRAPRMTGRPHNGQGRHWVDSRTDQGRPWVESLYGTGRGIVLGAHAERIGKEGYWDAAGLADYLDWMKAAQDAGHIRVVTLSEWAWARSEPAS